MKLITLMENTSLNANYFAEHGLSIYLDTGNHHVIFDSGASCLTLSNARKCDIPLDLIDTIIISHGHYDHAGGLITLKAHCPNADIYMQKTAALPFYHDTKYIGIDRNILNLEKLHLINGNHEIDQELILFSGITGRKCWPESNRCLSIRTAGQLVQDDFRHEQCLSAVCNDKKILISGCAHNGILNILDRYNSIYHCMPDIVVSGFHMMKKSPYTREEIECIETTAHQLASLPTVFYTGHCTGSAAIDLMKPIMRNKLQLLHAGEPII